MTSATPGHSCKCSFCTLHTMTFSFEMLTDYLSTQSILILGFAFVLYIAASRLLLHSLTSFPGPRLAALTELYVFYYEIVKDGLFVDHLKDLHRIYGPVVRIRPNELHFSSPRAFFAIYPSHSGFTKDPLFYAAFDADEASFGLVNVDDHKKRRDLLNPLFSRRAIIKFERNIQDTVDKFIDRLREFRDEPVNFRLAFRSFTMDVITMYSYGYSWDGVGAPGFDHPITASVDGAIKTMATSRYFPILQTLQRNISPDFFKKIDARLAGYAYMRHSLSTNIDQHLADPAALRKAEHETIYHHLLPESVNPRHWPSKDSLLGEAQVLFTAGTDTTSNALSFGLYHLLVEDNAPILKKLEDELYSTWPEKDSPFSYEQAEKLPYLTAVIKESMRISIGVPVPLPRVVQVPTIIDGTQVPAGAVVSASTYFVLMNSDIFPQPEKFIPERWLQSNVAELDKHLVVFSRGPRSCLGMNLAWCEMYLTLSHLLRKFELKIYDTRSEDMEIRAYMLPSWTGKGVRAMVKERLA